MILTFFILFFFKVAPDFCLTMHCEQQIEAIHRIPAEHRVLHVDSSGGFCKITKEMNDQYQQLMNYVFLLKNASDFDIPAVIVNEVITSRQDTCRIGEMFHLLKYNYKKVFDTSLNFRFIVSDLSWATIHAALEIMNLETVEEYAVRIFKYASDNNMDQARFLSFLSSCVSHTMNRFTKGLKRHVKFLDTESKTFAVCCFSLLVNCTDLVTSKRIFNLICIVFKSEFLDENVIQARQALQALIQLRPNDAIDVKSCIQEIYKDGLDLEGETDINSEGINNVTYDDDWFTLKTSTIKKASPFTKVFQDIESSILPQVSINDLNTLLNQEYLNFLQHHFMPYIFIWSGFVYRETKTDHTLTRLTQGVIEKFFGTRRRIHPKPQVPARHIISSMKHALANCAISQNNKEENQEIKENLDTEQTATQAIDIWRTKVNRKQKINTAAQLLKTVKRKKMKFSYQNKQKTLHNMDKHQPTQPVTTQSVIIPTQPVILPTQPVIIPTQPVIIPTQPVILPTQPVIIPTQPVIIPTQPVIFDEIVEDDKKVKIKNFCSICKKQFPSSQLLYQHNKNKNPSK